MKKSQYRFFSPFWSDDSAILPPSTSNLPHRLVPADIADLQPQRFLLAADRTVPEVLGFLAVLDDKAVLVDLDLTVGVPLALGGGAVQTQVLDQLQAGVADLDGLEGLLGGGV